MLYKQNISNANFSVQLFMDSELHEYLHLNRQIELRAAWHIRHSNRKGSREVCGAVGNPEVLDRPPFPSLPPSFSWSASNCLYSCWPRRRPQSQPSVMLADIEDMARAPVSTSFTFPHPSPVPGSSALSNGFEQFDGSTCARPRHNSQHFPSVRLYVHLSSATTPIWRLTWAHVWWKICQSRAAVRR